jgi:hypothetical protein
MPEWFVPVLVLGGYFVVMKWLLPKAGVPT